MLDRSTAAGSLADRRAPESSEISTMRHLPAPLLAVALVAIAFVRFVIEPRQLSVGRQRGDLEVDRAVAGVGVAAAIELVDHVRHGLQVFRIRRPRRVFHRLDAKRHAAIRRDLDARRRGVSVPPARAATSSRSTGHNSATRPRRSSADRP